jgi:hypothetical protein
MSFPGIAQGLPDHIHTFDRNNRVPFTLLPALRPDNANVLAFEPFQIRVPGLQVRNPKTEAIHFRRSQLKN